MLLGFLVVALSFTEARWDAILASPKVTGTEVGTGVVIGTDKEFAYVLTAAHVVAGDRVGVEFTSRKRYPLPSWESIGAKVVLRFPDPDLALLRFPLPEKREVPVLPLAPAWQRPKSFPVPVLKVGIGDRGATAIPDVLRAKEFVHREGHKPAFFWRTDGRSEKGRSGGPLLDSQNRVIGITAANRGNAGYYAHHDEILAALKREGFGWLISGPEVRARGK